MLTIVGHNLVSDLSTIVRAGHALPENVVYFDTEVGARWCWPEQSDCSLEHLVLRMTSMGQWRETLGKLEFDDFEAMSDEQLSRRCG